MVGILPLQKTGQSHYYKELAIPNVKLEPSKYNPGKLFEQGIGAEMRYFEKSFEKITSSIASPV